MSESILRMPEVQARTGLSRSSIYERLKATPQTFPSPVKIGERSIGFVESEINDWIAQRIAESRGQAA